VLPFLIHPDGVNQKAEHPCVKHFFGDAAGLLLIFQEINGK
jgi:hypothetical protein